MKKMLVVVLGCLLVASTAFSAPFAPTLLKLSANPVIQYDFDGSALEIPVQVSGKTAAVIFAVYTKGKANSIPNIRNGYLGWHQVNKVDTCLFYSAAKSLNIGAGTISWDGKDQDGGVVPAGEYTYYLWAYDDKGSKEKMTQWLRPYSSVYEMQEVDPDGLPLAQPIYYHLNKRWRVGNDPYDYAALDSIKVTAPTGWTIRNIQAMDPKDFNFFYMQLHNVDATQAGLTKWKWVPGGEAEMQTDFGDNGFSELFNAPSGDKPGVVAGADYLYTGDQNHVGVNDPDVQFYIYDYQGTMIKEVDLAPWWASREAQELGAQMNGGPNELAIRHEKVFLNCHCSCIKQMVDPIRYLETEEYDDFYVWTNTNGDYVLDHNFEETATLKWICNDYNVGPYTYNLAADDLLWSECPAYDVGAVSFGLMGPDGTGIGYFAFSGETAGWKKGSFFIDSGTAFDGLYCDNEQAGGTHYAGWKANEFTAGCYFIGHDSIMGVITNSVGVEDAAPAAFTVAQNSPNPFNPTTTISFSLVNAGDVNVDIFNVAGQKVDTLANGFMAAGSHSVVWDASDFSAGVYFYTVKAGSMSKTMKMTLVK